MLLLLACTAPPGQPGGVEHVGGFPREDASVYDPEVLHEVRITVDRDDWDALRSEERTYYDILGPGCMEGPFESPYAWYAADVTFDDVALGTVGVRKKGLIGSNSPDRPSLRIDTDHYVDGTRLYGLEKVVLNNNNQDQSRLRSCLAHAFFADAGLVAPRCSLAHVVVNGEDLGVYDNAEAIEAELVERVRGDTPATMYEGTLSDFREGWLATFEAETDTEDRAELAAVAAALEADDDHLLDALDAVLDLDAFFTFWAAESFAGHWDGYNGNTNNFYVYAAPEDGRLEFIASGPDAAFDSREPFGEGQPIWVATTSALANRLISHRDGKALYAAEITRLLEDVWNVEARLDRIDSWKELVRDVTSLEERGAIADLRDIVAARGDDLADAIGGRVSAPALRSAVCWAEIGSVSVDFATTFGSYPTGDLYAGGDAVTAYEIRGVPYPTTQDGVTAGIYSGDDVLWFTVSEIAQDTYLAPYVVFDRSLLVDGADIALDWDAAQGALLYNAPSTGGAWQTAAYLGGTLSFTTASDVDDAPLIGVLTASILGGE